MKKILLTFIFVLVACTLRSTNVFPYRSYPPVISSPSEDVNCMLIGKEGLIWVGTNNGLVSYDGYLFNNFRSDAYSPGILPNNAVRSLAEDHGNGLWIGTRNGLVRMDKLTGTFQTYYLPKESQRIIYTLFVSRDGTLWIGTDGGLTRFNIKTGKSYTYNRSNTWVVTETGQRSRISDYSVKAIVENRNGDLLVGTWSSGLFLLKRGSNTMYRYPKLNEANSAYSLFLDSKQRLWVGTWGQGVMRIDNPDNIRNPHITRFPYSTNHFDTFYKIVNSPDGRSIWACTREGICTIPLDGTAWQQYITMGSTPLNYCNDIAFSKGGDLWVSTQNSGLIQATMRQSPFRSYSLVSDDFPINYIASIYTGDGNKFWMGLNPYGVALYDRKENKTLYNKAIPGFGSLPSNVFTTSISSIVKRFNGDLWFAVNNYGIIVRKTDGSAYMLNSMNSPWIREDYVNTVFESSDHVMWVGFRNGLSVVLPNNKGIKINMRDGSENFSYCDVRDVSQDHQGAVWIATDNKGIIRVTGRASNPKSLRFKRYCPNDGNYPVYDATALHEDRFGRLWAISNSSGLFLYNKVKDAFEPKNHQYHLPGEQVKAINEDANGGLWLTTDRDLLHLSMTSESDEPIEMNFFSKEDGIGDVHFSANSTCTYGREIFFSGSNNFFSFFPENIRNLPYVKNSLIVSDITIGNVPLEDLQDSDLRKRISKVSPMFAHEITIPSGVKEFSVIFALLTYGDAHKNVYSYKLEGYSDQWQYSLGDGHRATFQNLPSGKYKLRVRATDNYGHMQELPYDLILRVLPPWYATWWAFMLFILVAIALVWLAVRWYKIHLRTRNSLQMGVFLTNITHEFLTPLTVIGATVHKLKDEAPQYADDYRVIDGNISRLSRLLRQILEVRKSQAGKLRLRVNRDDIVLFVSHVAESIRPFAEQRDITLNVDLPSVSHYVWFDADKLDKVLYNLISNAIKYNHKGGSVTVTLSLVNDKAIVKVSDTGIGMSRYQLRHLYTRFFDGDYRRQHTKGTGIGLALTHDLVTLAHGSITCESMENEGSTFTVTLPVKKSAFSEREIDKSEVSSHVDRLVAEELTMESEADVPSMDHHHKPYIWKNAPRILIVEDNPELLDLMAQTLGKTYTTLTARNGKQAWNIINKEQLDLVVSDVMMPVMDGLELTKLIKSDKGYWQLPVLLLTAKSSEDSRNEGYSAGADAYLAKPFRFEDLEVRIESLLLNRRKTRDTYVGSSKEKGKTKASHYSNPETVFVDKARQCVMNHLNDPDYDRAAFAADMAMGESSLYNKLKAATDMTVTAFITDIRMKEAKNLIDADPDMLVSELSANVGFNSPKYFSRCFKKAFGILPGEYAEKVKEQ